MMIPCLIKFSFVLDSFFVGETPSSKLEEAKVKVVESKSVCTSSSVDATTQTPVHVHTQTERSAVSWLLYMHQ